MAISFDKLSSPRPIFPADIPPAAGAAMERHFACWGDQLSQGNAMVYGPVADLARTYGVAIIIVNAAGGAVDWISSKTKLITRSI
jgi:hypothetical protein